MIGARRCRTSTIRLCAVSYIALLHVALRAMAAAPLLPQQRAVLPYMVFPKPNPRPAILRNPQCLPCCRSSSRPPKNQTKEKAEGRQREYLQKGKWNIHSQGGPDPFPPLPLPSGGARNTMLPTLVPYKVRTPGLLSRPGRTVRGSAPPVNLKQLGGGCFRPHAFPTLPHTSLLYRAQALHLVARLPHPAAVPPALIRRNLVDFFS